MDAAVRAVRFRGDEAAGAGRGDDARLIRAVQDDPARFEEVYVGHVDAVFAYLVRRTGERRVAEDLTADTFERAFTAIQRFDWRGAPLRSWLVRIADRLATDWYRRRARRAVVRLAPDTERGATPSAEAVALARERDEAVYRALNDLSPAQRWVVVWHLGEGLAHRDIAQRLGRGEGAVRMLYVRGLRKMRERLRHDPDA